MGFWYIDTAACLLFFTIAPLLAIGAGLFSWHPTFMTLAFALFMMESILVYSPLSTLLTKADRKTKVTFHWMGMVSSLVFATAGVAFIWYNKQINGKPHMTSWHGTLGYITVVFVLIECIGGTIVKYSNVIKTNIRLADLKLYHATAGLLVFGLASMTIMLALYSDWFTKNVTGTAWYVCYSCPCILLLSVMNQITTSFAHRIGAPRIMLEQKKPPVATSKKTTSKK